MNLQISSKSLNSKGGALGVRKKIAKAFHEELLAVIGMSTTKNADSVDEPSTDPNPLPGEEHVSS